MTDLKANMITATRAATIPRFDHWRDTYGQCTLSANFAPCGLLWVMHSVFPIDADVKIHALDAEEMAGWIAPNKTAA